MKDFENMTLEEVKEFAKNPPKDATIGDMLQLFSILEKLTTIAQLAEKPKSKSLIDKLFNKGGKQ